MCVSRIVIERRREKDERYSTWNLTLVRFFSVHALHVDDKLFTVYLRHFAVLVYVEEL